MNNIDTISSYSEQIEIVLNSVTIQFQIFPRRIVFIKIMKYLILMNFIMEEIMELIFMILQQKNKEIK